MKLINADCIEAMKAMPDNSVDAIVTDPPYELGFMGKSWDASGIAFNIEVWQEALRVIKPGGHLIAFSGSRTYHRMAVAIEDAGFQIRDQIMWVYGSGFPKSHNVSKAIDKIEGVEPTVVGQRMAQGSARKIKGTNAAANKIPNSGSLEYDETIIYETVATSEAAQQWEGWGTALKPAHEPMVLARKPLEGTVANNVLTYGTGGLNIDGSRVEYANDDEKEKAIVMQSKPSLDIRGNAFNKQDLKNIENVRGDYSQGRFPANFIHDGSDEVVGLFPAVKGATSRTPAGDASIDNAMFGGGFAGPVYDDGLNTSAARFFYCAKASKRDRNEGLEGFDLKVSKFGNQKNGKDLGNGSLNDKFTNSPRANHHPTVKPVTLMQYLVRLVTPPNGIVLDPFMGSGSTGKACAYEGFDFIGIDQSAEYVAIAQARIDFALAHKSDELDL
jgi:site-specific DNA-methyltransferase (adenine-specific)